jgi:hypothetical protein
MMPAGRISGRAVVSVAVAGTLGMLGVCAVYLPYYADRDALRGMDEDGGMDEKSRREMQEYLKKQSLQDKPPVGSGSMWSNLRK